MVAAQAEAERWQRELELEEVKAHEAARLAMAVQERQHAEAAKLQEQVRLWGLEGSLHRRVAALLLTTRRL